MAVILENNLHHDQASEAMNYDQVADTIVELGNRMLEDESADVWEVASGIMAGAIQFWLYSRQPCEDPLCQACANISSPDGRIAALLREARAVAEESDYYSSVNDVTTGTA
ncbi:MAG: hypothetical protein ACR2QG_04695 [Gammaproteobacteria bacterium]